MKTKENIDYHPLLVKLFAGEISKSKMEELKLWLREDLENFRIFNKENELWQLIDIFLNQPVYKTETDWQKLCSKLGINSDSVSNQDESNK